MSCKKSIAVCAAHLCLFVAPLVAADRMQIRLDATDAPLRRLAAHLVIPAKPGPMTLYYPKWIAGEHGPTGPVTDLTGIKIRSGGKPVSWLRDDVDLYALQVIVPSGASQIEVDVEFISSPNTEGFSAAASMTPRLAVIYWNQVLLYPSGSIIQRTEIEPTLILPKGWKMACALPVANSDAVGPINFKPVTLERLCDSPVLCGQYLKEIPIGPAGGAKHWLCIAADSENALQLSPELKANYDRLVAEALALFGARHYDSYRFLLTLSDNVASFGLEHHDSSDNRLPERTLIDPAHRKTYGAVLLCHEMVHSWNGKYRRPAAMVVDDFQQPVRTRMLWIYEGLTEYLGRVLAARSGLWTPEISRDSLAHIADWAQNRAGRDWRSLEDTAIAAQHLYGSRSDGSARRRSVDFYDEGALIWLDADVLIREKTKGQKSLDDFCQIFFGGQDGPPAVKSYEFEDVVQALNRVLPYDWKGFFEKRVILAGGEAPLNGIERGGWKLAYAPKRSNAQEAYETEDKSLDLAASIGLLLKDSGAVVDVIPHSPADKAGVAPGMKLLAVNGRRWTPELLRAAIGDTKNGAKLELLLENSDFIDTMPIRYTEGEKYPKLERVESRPDYLGDILKAKTPVIVPK